MREVMGYGMIADIGSLLTGILRRELVPDVIAHDYNIGLCSPDDHGDLSLSIYLYDINLNEETPYSGMINTGVGKQAYPSAYLDLYYMITAYSASDIKFRAAEEHKILGKVIQALHIHSVLGEEMLGNGAGIPARIELQRLEQQEKNRLWNFSNLPYKLSLFYRVCPVEIASDRTRDIVRVRDIGFTVQERKERSYVDRK